MYRCLSSVRTRICNYQAVATFQRGAVPFLKSSQTQGFSTASSGGKGEGSGARRWLSNFFGGSSHSANDGEVDSKRTRGNLTAKAKKIWSEEKEKYLNMPLTDKRRIYKCRKLNTLDDVPSWSAYYKENQTKLLKIANLTKKKKYLARHHPPVNEDLNEKVSIWKGDITSLEIDSIVNAANASLLGGGGVDGAIHEAAGSLLVEECRTLNRCDTGQSKITGGYKLPAKYVIHTVGPMRHGEDELESCYLTSFEHMSKYELKSVAFPCISTGIYGFPNLAAAQIALGTTRDWLEKNGDKVDRVIFCLFLAKDVEIYECLMQQYFPVSGGHNFNTEPEIDDKADTETAEEGKANVAGSPEKDPAAERSPKKKKVPTATLR